MKITKTIKMDSERTALEQWAKDNGIDIQYLMFGGKHGGRGGFGHKMRFDTDASTQNN